ncbi:MAG: RNase adapter RapZ [Acidimicrobiia bacterium]|nr:RNase adapter RapZ [Acidimicrobiia bacterium]
MNEFVVITGLSGAGRTQAANSLEDLGWFVIDNLPPELIPKVADLAKVEGSPIERVALVVGGGYHEQILPAIAELRTEADKVRVVFLEAATDQLIRRYESTRRRHPFSTEGSVGDAIVAEREALEPVKAEADIVINTTELNVHDLRRRMVELFGDDVHDAGMHTSVMSFGFKHGLPLDVDMVIDCRFLPNPHWVEELRPLTGLDEPVRDYVLGQDIAGTFLERIDRLLGLLMPAYVREGKSYFTIAFGCTGGHHRSVAITEHVAQSLRGSGFDPTIVHRDIDK